MLRIFLVALLFVLCFSVHAQEEVNPDLNSKHILKIGVKGGLSLPSLSDNSDNIYTENFKSFASFEGGFFINYGISKKLSLQIELNYAKKGGERTGIQPIPPSAIAANVTPEIAEQIPPGTVFYADFKNRNELQYFEIPLLLKFSINKKQWDLFVNGGPYIGFLMKANQVTSGTSEIYFDEGREIPLIPEASFDAETDVKDSLNDFNCGGILGLGVTRQIGLNSDLLFEIRGTYGFIPLQKDEKFGKSYVGSVLFSIGYIYNL